MIRQAAAAAAVVALVGAAFVAGSGGNDGGSGGNDGGTTTPAAEGGGTPTPAADASKILDCGTIKNVDTSQWDTTQIRNAALLANTAKQAGADVDAQVAVVAAAMQESSLMNMTGGDRDSVGFLQQRPSQGWGTAAQIRDPAFAVASFLNGRGSNPGLNDVPGWRSLPLATAIQRVQRSGFPTAYAKWEGQARTLVSQTTGEAACVAGTAQFPITNALSGKLPRANPRSSAEAVAFALSKVGTPVRPSICQAWVAQTYGWNYSGQYTAILQWETTPANMKHPKDENPPAGALVFYWSKNPARHVALSVGGGKIVSTDWPRGRIGATTVQAMKSWGAYLGWAEPYYPKAG